MKPAWDKLASDNEGSTKVLIADVDCTAGGKQVCSTYGVKGFPTIKYFNPPDTEGEEYEGGRSYEELSDFVKTLGPGCSVSNKEQCSAEQLVALEDILKRPEADRVAEVNELRAQLKIRNDESEKKLEEIEAMYEAEEEALEKFSAEVKPKIKLLMSTLSEAAAKQVIPVSDDDDDDDDKDEV